MILRRFATGTLVLLFAAAAPSAVAPSHPRGVRVGAVAGAAHLRAFGARSAAQIRSATGSKLDGALAELSRHIVDVRADSALADLHALSPAARFRQSGVGATPEVLVDVVTRGDPQALRSALVALGLERPAVYLNDVGGWLPVTQIEAAAARAEVHSLRAAMPRRRAAVALQGDFAQRSDVVRTTYTSLTGTGVTVGVLSDSFDCYSVYAAAGSGVPASGVRGYASNGFTADAAADESSGALPSSVKVLTNGEPDCLSYGAPQQLPFTDEGRAMLQVVHAVAPGASLAFYTGDNSEADFASGIHALAAAGAKVIADDVGYFDEPFYQDGLIAQAIDAVEAQGVAYFSAAGNDARYSYENAQPSFATRSTAAANSGEYLLNFDTSGLTDTTTLTVTVPPLFPGEFIGLVLEWDQPYVTGAPTSGGATSHLDLCVTGALGSDVLENLDSTAVTCSGATPANADPYSSGADPVEILILGNPASNNANSAQTTINIMVGLADGTAPPGRVKLAVLGDGLQLTINSFATMSPTIQGHPGAAGAAAVGAAPYYETPRCGTTPATLEPFSSSGGTPILFDVNGTRLSAPVYRQKPDFVGPDGINTTFLGFTLASDGITVGSTVAQCQTDASYPNFFGTSAATPHAAGIAALMLQANPSATPAEIYAALQKSALPMAGNSAPNYDSGYGFIQADAALAEIPPAAPTLSLASSSVQAGQSTTLTWTSIATTGCTASGGWSGALASSGSQTITPATPGTDTYSLTCTNAAGTSPAASAQLTVTSAPSSGGGGQLDVLSLLILAAAVGSCCTPGTRVRRSQ